MSRVDHSTPILTTLARLRLTEVRQAVDAALSTGVRDLDPEQVTRFAEAFLDRVAEDIAAEPLRCTDCGIPVPTYRQRRWYYAGQNAHVFDILCHACDGRREDAEAETLAFTASCS